MKAYETAVCGGFKFLSRKLFGLFWTVIHHQVVEKVVE